MTLVQFLIGFVRAVLKFILALLSIMILYLVIALIASAIPVNTGEEPEGDITIYFRSNGIHTSYVFPYDNPLMDWGSLLDPTHAKGSPDPVNFIAFGWGDLAFYKRTPQWNDLTFPVAFQAVFLSKPTALHVEYLQAMRFDQKLLPVTVTARQYQKLVDHVRNSFQLDPSGKVQKVEGLHYFQNDAFYRATGSLHFFYTCNTWINGGLKKAGMRAALWTPFEEGIFFHYQ